MEQRTLFGEDGPRRDPPAVEPVRLPLDCLDEAIYNFAERWTERLVAEDYAGAWGMLLHVPGEVWAANVEVLQVRVVNYGSPNAIPGEPVCRVTPIKSATGERWRWLPKLTRKPVGDPHRSLKCLGRLDWQLPLNGEWSDLVASFDLVDDGGELAFVLAALRVP